MLNFKVRCRNCGAANRVPKYSQGSWPVCAGCNSALPFGAVEAARVTDRHRLVVSLLAVAAAAIGIANVVRPMVQRAANTVPPTTTVIRSSQSASAVAVNTVPPSTTVMRSSQSASTMASRDALQPVPIKTGIISKAKPTGALAELKLATPSGKNYLIKLVDAKTSSQRMLIYIEGGKTFDTKISLGTYRIRVASGATWYGSQALFGPGTTLRPAAGHDEHNVRSGRYIHILSQWQHVERS